LTNSSSQDPVTQLLLDLNHDAADSDTQQRLWDAVYLELRRIADRLMRSESTGHTLQPTALVHEAYVKLIDQKRAQWHDRAQFYAVAARIMRRILVDHAREKAALKRGGDHHRITLSDELFGSLNPMDPILETITLDRALDRLAKLSARMARVVELRVFGGLTMLEIAHVLGVSKRTADNDWVAARQWLTLEFAREGS
jgi:RNA polymerase sigma factor (TIGR02999 family)